MEATQFWYVVKAALGNEHTDSMESEALFNKNVHVVGYKQRKKPCHKAKPYLG